MNKFDGILLCTDLDGTLLNSENIISQQNLDAIEYFKSEGGMFTFVTGRMPVTVTDIYNKVNPNVPFCCINGGGIYDHRTQKYCHTIELPKTAFELLDYIDKEMPDMGIQLNAFNDVYFCKDNHAMVRFREVTGLPEVFCHYKDVDEPVAKVIFAHDDESELLRLIDLLAKHPKSADFDFIRSQWDLYEILPKGVDKGAGLKNLADYLGVDIKKTVAAGDYFNDVAMIRCAGTGIAVANACDEVKAAADVVTVSNNDHAIAKIIEDIEAGKIKL